MRGHVLLFLGNRCHSCHPLVAQLAAGDAQRAPLVVVVVDEPPAEKPNIMEALSFSSPSRLIYDPTRAIANRVAMPGIPFAYAVDGSGRVRVKRAVRTIKQLPRMAAFIGK